jgi:hypothetical protein
MADPGQPPQRTGSWGFLRQFATPRGEGAGNRCPSRSQCLRLDFGGEYPPIQDDNQAQETSMQKLLGLALVALFACGSAFAADTKTTDAKTTDGKNAQQEKMKMCNEKAGDKKGDERQAFMKTCLSSKPEKPKSKMAMCNEKTKGMSKADADKARSECMKAT